MYLDCPDLDQEEPGWTLRTEFHITLVHPDDDTRTIHKSERSSAIACEWRCAASGTT